MSRTLPNFFASVLYSVVSSCPLLCLTIQVLFEKYFLNLRDQNVVGRAFLHLCRQRPSVIWALKSKQMLDNPLCMLSVFINLQSVC